MAEKREARKFIDSKVEKFIAKIIKKPEKENELIVMTQCAIEDAITIQDNFLSASGIFVTFVTVDQLSRPTIIPGDEIAKLLKYKEDRERKRKEEMNGVT